MNDIHQMGKQVHNVSTAVKLLAEATELLPDDYPRAQEERQFLNAVVDLILAHYAATGTFITFPGPRPGS